MANKATTGQIIKALRKEQKLSQETESSSRYISCIETGRSHPSRALLLRLARELNVDDELCNELLISARHSPLQAETVSEQDQEEVLAVLKRLIQQNPYPSVITNHYGDILEHNTAMDGIIEELLGSSAYLNSDGANMYLLELDPALCRPFIANLAAQQNYRLMSLRKECLRTPDDAVFQQLLNQLQAFQKNDPVEASGDLTQQYFSELHIQYGEQLIKFYWFYGAIGSQADQLCDDLQTISALPADSFTEQVFKQFSQT